MTGQAQRNGGFGKLVVGLVIGLVIGLIGGVILGPVLDNASAGDYSQPASPSPNRVSTPADSREDRTPPVPAPGEAQPTEDPEAQPAPHEPSTEEPTEG